MSRRVVRRGSPQFPTVGSLFAGVGGFDLAAEAVGMPVIAAAEFDPSANTQVNQEVLAARFPGAKLLGDVSEVSYQDLGRPSVITAGSPCQDFSIAGLRAGMAGARSGLFAQFVRIIGEGEQAGTLRYALWENVLGALSSNKGEDFANVVGALVGASGPLHLPKRKGRVSRYAGVAQGPSGQLAWRALDARNFGAPQRRQRIFAVLDLHGNNAHRILFPEWEDGAWLDELPRTELDDAWACPIDDDAVPFETGMYPEGGREVLLADVLEQDVDPKYYLSAKACAGILRRAEKRGKELPEALRAALEGGVQAFAPDVARPLLAKDNDSHREDMDTYVARPFVPDAAHTLTGEGFDASEDGTGRATPLVASSPQHVNLPDSLAESRTNKDECIGFYPTGGTHGVSAVENGSPALKVGSTSGAGYSTAVAQTLPRYAAAITAREAKGPDSDATTTPVVGEKPSLAQRPGSSGQDSASESAYVPEFAATLTSGEGSNGRHAGRRQEDDFNVVAGSMSERANTDLAVAPTLTSSASPNRGGSEGLKQLTSYGVRRLTPTECERLQGFPDGWTDVDAAKDSRRYRQLGNAVAVPNAAWILARIRAAFVGDEMPTLSETLAQLPWLRTTPSAPRRRRIVRGKP